MECEAGSINVILGLNGSGKTTLIKLMAGLYKPNCGNIYYNDLDFLAMTIAKKSSIVSYVPQNHDIYGNFLVRDYLLFGTSNELDFYKSPGDEEEQRVDDCAKEFGIANLLNKGFYELSGGQKQIVSICGAAVQQTPIILLDEPTSSLDVCSQHAVLSKLKDMAGGEKKTIVMSSHNPNHALYLESNVFLLKDSTIVESGKAREIVTVDGLRSVYGESICLSKDLEYEEVSFKDRNSGKAGVKS